MNFKRKKLIDSILARVAQDGWTLRALEQGAKAAGVPAEEARLLFADGIAGVVAAFQEMIDENMQAAIKAKRNFPAMRIRDKVTFALRARLEAMEPYRDAARRLSVWYLMPRNLKAGAEHLWHTADTVWIAAGDVSDDYNRYTKRLLLIGVMKTTFAFWLNDETPGRGDTWEFLDRRIGDVMTVGKGINIAKTFGIADILSFMRSRFAA